MRMATCTRLTATLVQSQVSFLINDRSKACGKSLLYEARRVAPAAGFVYEIPAPAVIDDGDLHSHDEAPTRMAGLRARPKQRDLSWGPGDGSQPKKPTTAGASESPSTECRSPSSSSSRSTCFGGCIMVNPCWS